jgi:LytS/YehU family sensor histidine kinase
MKAEGFTTIATVVVALHLAVLGFMFGPVAWQYLLVAVLSGVLIWGVGSAVVRRRRWVDLFVGMVVALAVQQIAFRWWRAQFAGAWLPLVQFAALHVLIRLGFSRWRRP